jgi:hypothetical protein
MRVLRLWCFLVFVTCLQLLCSSCGVASGINYSEPKLTLGHGSRLAATLALLRAAFR